MCKESNVVNIFKRKEDRESKNMEIKEDSRNDSNISTTIKDDNFDVLDENCLEKVKKKFEKVWKRNIENLARLEKTRINGNNGVLKRYKIK